MFKRSRHFSLLVALAAMFCMVAALALSACGGQKQEEPEVDDEAIAPADTAEEVQAPTLPTEPFYVLLVGDDTRRGTSEANVPQYADGNARSDTIMLLRVDPALYDLAIVTVPRDTAALVDDRWTKINASYWFHGIQGLQDQIEGLTGVRPTYYLDLTFVGFEDFINDLGGLTVNVPVDMGMADIVSGDYVQLQAGEQHLNGAEALVLARMRKMFADNQDALRQVSDRAIVAAGIRYVAAHPDTAEAAVAALVGHADTNWDQAELLALVQDFCAHESEISILSGTGPHEGWIDGGVGEWLVPYDADTWHALMAHVSEGGDPNDMVSAPSFGW